MARHGIVSLLDSGRGRWDSLTNLRNAWRRLLDMSQENSWSSTEPPPCSVLWLLWPVDMIIIQFCVFISLSPQQTTETGDDEEDQPLSLAWPSNPRKQVTFLIVLPIVFPLWLTLPDVRKPVSKAFELIPCLKAQYITRCLVCFYLS